MPASTIEDARGVLYGEDAGSFVAARNAMVKLVRDEGNRELAAEIKALRKPSVVAAELNRVVRIDEPGVATLLAAVEALREGQTEMLSGGEVDVAGLQQAYRHAVQLVAQGAASHRVEIRAALEAAAVDADSHDALVTGTFVTVPTSSGGFGLVAGGLATLPAVPTKPASAKKRKAAAPKADDAKRRAVKRAAQIAALKEIKMEAAAAHRVTLKAARDAASDRAASEKSVAARLAEVAALEESLDEKRDELQTATEALDIAASADKFASKRAAQTQAELDHATEALEAKHLEE